MSFEPLEQNPSSKNLFDNIRNFVCRSNVSNTPGTDAYFTRNQCKF